MSRTILVVEDDPDTRDLLRMCLELEGFSVHTAEDGLRGLNLAASKRPDLILTDLSMPGMDGVDLIRAVRQHPELGRTPIAAVTAHGRDFGEQALMAGADRVLYKPEAFSHIIAIVTEMLR